MQGSSDNFVYDVDYQAVLDSGKAQGFTRPNKKNRLLQNEMVLELKNYGLWYLLDELYVTLGNGSPYFKMINFIHPEDSIITTGTFENDSIGRLILDNFSTTVSPYLWGDVPKRTITKNSVTLGHVAYNNNSNVIRPFYSGNDIGGYYVWTRELVSSTRLYINSSSFLTVSDTSQLNSDFKAYTRNVNMLKSYENYTLKGSGNITPQDFPATKQPIEFYSDKNGDVYSSLIFTGQYMDETDVFDFNDIFNTYKNAFEAL